MAGKRFCFVVKSTKGVCFPWKCDAQDEREAYSKLWAELQDELDDATMSTEEGANFHPYKFRSSTPSPNPR